jgi:CRISPR-associated protein Cmr6
VSLVARSGQFPPATDKGKPIDLGADLLLSQAKAALALLCRFGGVGAKGRKGFGSFADLPAFDLVAIKHAAADFRARCGLGASKFQPTLAGSPSLEQLLGPLEVPAGGANWWLALDQLAASAQAFAKNWAHRREKKALGLPRDLKKGENGPFNPGRHVKNRHASPVLYHFDKVGGNLVARVVAFPAVELPNLPDSTKLLQELLGHLGGDLGSRFADHVKGKPPPAGGRPTGAGPTSQTAASSQLKPGMRVKAKIVEDPKGKGRPYAECQGLVGNILGVPAGRTLTVGEELELAINSVNVANKQIAFKWPS